MITGDPQQEQIDEVSVNVALAALATFQGYVEQADAKINTILMVHTGGVVAAAAALGGSWAVKSSPLVMTVLSAFGAAFVVSGFHVVKALRPRIHPPVPLNPFGMTGTALCPPVTRRAQRDYAWAMAGFLGEIALTKNRHLVRATPWTVLMLSLGVLAAAVCG